MDDTREVSRSGLLIAVLTALCLVVVALGGLLALDPGFLVAVLPGWFTGPTSVGRTLQVVGGLALLIPVAAAAVAQLRGRRRAAGWFVVLAVLAFAPAAVAISHGADEVRRATESGSPEPGACVEYSGGDTKCPGG